MKRLSLSMLAVCLLLGVVAGQALGQEKVKLEYKFTPNELLRYKMTMTMNMSMRFNISGMTEMPEGGQMPLGTMQLVTVVRQRTKKVLPNGDAEVVVAIESMKVSMDDRVESYPTDKIPTTTMIMSKNGAVKEIKGLDKMQEAMGGMQFMDPGSFSQFLGQSGAFPDTAIAVGEKWMQDVPFPMGTGSIHVDNELVSLDSKVGSYKVAEFKQNFAGDLDFSMPIPVPAEQAANGTPNMDANARFTGDAKVSFSPEKGQVVRTEGKMQMNMSIGLRGADQGQSGTMDMAMDMDINMFLLPPEQGK